MLKFLEIYYRKRQNLRHFKCSLSKSFGPKCLTFYKNFRPDPTILLKTRNWPTLISTNFLDKIKTIENIW